MILDFIILLVFAHILADYVFQWQGLVDRKKDGKIGAFVVHVSIFFCLALIATMSWFSWIWLAIIFLLSVLHLFQDLTKVRLQNQKPKWAFQLEIFDHFFSYV